jgi:dihydroneopterin triphosphate diphosphatase
MRKDLYEIPIRCQGIAVILLKIVKGEYRVLLMKRATPILKDVWCYIGGGIEEGEKAWESALREIQEETGITKVSLYISNKFDQFYSSRENYIYVAPVFVGYVDEEEDVVLNPEHIDYKWMIFEEAKERAILPGNDEVLDHIERHFVKRNPLEWLRVEGTN